MDDDAHPMSSPVRYRPAMLTGATGEPAAGQTQAERLDHAGRPGAGQGSERRAARYRLSAAWEPDALGHEDD
jgi:hypothetical protein